MAAVWTLAVVLVLLAAGALGRRAAVLVRQPPVVGEIVVGLAVGPVLVTVLRSGALAVDPSTVESVLTLIGEAALVLYLVVLTRDLRSGPAVAERAAAVRVAAGSFVPALVVGAGLAGLVLLTGGPSLRGTASQPAFVLYLATALAATAVPVLARILTDRGLAGRAVGRLALAAAIVTDTAVWLLLAVSLGLDRGGFDGVVVMLVALAAGLALSWSGSRVLRRLSPWCAARPAVAAVALGAVALVCGFGAERAGLTVILGATLVGLAVPHDGPASPWTEPVRRIEKASLPLLPVFFVSAGMTVVATGLGAVPWWWLAVIPLAGAAAKIGGGYLGARLGGRPRLDAVRIGALLNTRGLTELVVLQIGLRAGLVTPPLFLVMVVMTLFCTALTGPLLSLVDHVDAPADVPSPVRGVDPTDVRQD